MKTPRHELLFKLLIHCVETLVGEKILIGQLQSSWQHPIVGYEEMKPTPPSTLNKHAKFHFTMIGNMMCSFTAASLWRQVNCQETDNEKQTERTQAQGGQNKESEGEGKNKLYNSCCLGTLSGINREATINRDHCKCMFLLQLQGELHTWGCRGSTINHLIFIVPSMLLAMLLETPPKKAAARTAALKEKPTLNRHSSILLY